MRQLGLTHDASYPEPASVSRERLSILSDQVLRSLRDGADEGPATLIDEAVRASVEAFVTSGAHIGEAVREVSALVDKIGCREAYRSSDASRLHESFQQANVAVQRGLDLAVGDIMTNDVMMLLRQDLMGYLAQLHKVAIAGFERTSRLMGLNDEDRLVELRSIVFRGTSARDVDQLASTIGFDPGQRVMAIISVRHELPASICNHPQILVDESRTMALMAEEWTSHLSSIPFRGQVVLGPAATVVRSFEGVALARNASALLRDGTVVDDRIIVPSIDLLGELLVRGNRLLAELLIDKHLSPLEALPPGRRLALAQILLISLERSQSVNRIARDLGLAAQTAHNRMNSLRSMLGPKLDDADQRLELIVAVRAALNRWTKP